MTAALTGGYNHGRSDAAWRTWVALGEHASGLAREDWPETDTNKLVVHTYLPD